MYYRRIDIDLLLDKVSLIDFIGHHQSFQSHQHHAGSQIGSVQPHELTTRLQQVHRMGNQGKFDDSIRIVISPYMVKSCQMNNKT